MIINEKFKSILFEYGAFSTAYGIPNLIRSKKFYQKILWISFLVVATSAAIWFNSDAIINFFEFKVVTVISSVYEQPAEFPTISLCSYSSRYFDNKPLNRVITECFFGLDYSCQKQPEKYFESFNSFYGQCYRFNSGKNITNQKIPIHNSTIGGIDDSFSLTINKHVDMAIWIHNRSSPPRISIYNNHYMNRIFISSNSYTQISIDKVIETQLSEPFNACIKDVNEFSINKTIIDYFRLRNEQYNYEKCLELCFDLYYLQNNPCGCSNASFGNVINECLKNSTSRLYNCTTSYLQNFYAESVNDKCAKYCPLECSTVLYNFQISPLVNYNATRLRIYYRTLKYTSIKQEPKMAVIDLISNIGGTFGLFIGASFVSLFELTEMLIELILNISFPKLKYLR